MAKSGIDWCDYVWNPIVGCSKYSAGCKNCWAETMAKRLRGMGLPQYQSVVDEKGWTGKIALVPEALDKPLHWRKPRRVFVGSMTDLFHESLTLGDLTPVWQSMADAPQHIYQILTKRAKRMMHAVGAMKGYFPVPHLWSGVTVENQQAADERIPYLLRTPVAEVRFVSVEPMLGPVNIGHCMHRYEVIEKTSPSGKQLFRCDQCGDETPGPCKWPYHKCRTLDWIIIGCESGPKRRPCKIEWVRDLVRQCRVAGVPVFVKQLDLDGRVSHNPAEWPEWARVREYPK